MAGTKNSGRRPLGKELAVVEWYKTLLPQAFAIAEQMLNSPKKSDRLWAMDWMKTGLVKMIPQKIGGDPDNRTPIPLLHVRNHNGDQQNKPDAGEDTGSAGRDISVQDHLHPDLSDRPIPE